MLGTGMRTREGGGPGKASGGRGKETGKMRGGGEGGRVAHGLEEQTNLTTDARRK